MTVTKGHKKIGISYGKLIVEVISVVLAILLALAVDSCKTDRENRELASLGFERIKDEMANNMEKVSDLLKKHEEMMAPLPKAIEKLKDGKLNEVKKIDLNLQIDFLHKTAWKTAMVTQALRYMDFKLVQRISSVYDLQDFYSAQIDDLVTIIKNISIKEDMEDRSFRGQFKKAVFNLRIVIAMEKNLIAVYKGFLNKPPSKSPAP